MAAFPEEITDSDIALDVAQETWRQLLKVTKDKSAITINTVKVKAVDATYTHKYEFSAVPSQQLLGYFASSLEDIVERKIISFVPNNTKLTLTFSSTAPEVEDDNAAA